MWSESRSNHTSRKKFPAASRVVNGWLIFSLLLG